MAVGAGQADRNVGKAKVVPDGGRTEKRPEVEVAFRRVQPAYRQVAEQLRAQILAGDLAPGDRLPTEVDLAVMFGASRTTIREGLRVLSSENLVTTSRGVGGGTFVSHPEPSSVATYLEASLGLLSTNETLSVHDLHEFRRMLEVPAMKLAAERRTDADLELMRANLAHDPSHGSEMWRYEQHRAFHLTLLEACNNPLLEMIAQPIFNTLRARFRGRTAPDGFAEQMHTDHNSILRAIERGDAAAASSAMSSHLDGIAVIYIDVE